MKMRVKLTLGFSFSVLILLLTIAFYLNISAKIYGEFEILKEDIVPGAIAIGSMEGTCQQIAHDLMDYMVAAGEEKEEETVRVGLGLLTKTSSEHIEHETHIGEEEKKEAGELTAKVERFASAAAEIINLKKEGAGVKELLKREEEILHPALETLVEQLTDHKARHMEELAEAEQTIHRAHVSSGQIALLASVLAVSLTTMIAFITTRSITKPLHALCKGTEMTGSGNLDYKVGTDVKDEIGELSRAFDKMTGDLKKTTVSRDILNAANQQLDANNQQLEAGQQQLRAANQQLGSEITERKRAQEDLEETHKKLLDASMRAGMAEVATDVLHNVGNVLNSVNVATTLIQEKVSKSEVGNLQKVAEIIKDNSDDLGTFFTQDKRGMHIPVFLSEVSKALVDERADTIDKLGSLAENIEHIKEIVKMQQSYARVPGVEMSTSLAELLENAIQINAAAINRHGVNLVRDFDDLPPVTIDKQKVLQILVNLISNAKYAMAKNAVDDKNLIIRMCKHGPDKVRIEVSDNGVGISKENMTKIFTHGFTTKKDGHGFGLHSGALAAGESGGLLTAHSDGEGKGSTFILDLPIKPAKVLQ